MFRHYLGKHERLKLDLFSHAVYSVCFGLLKVCYISVVFFETQCRMTQPTPYQFRGSTNHIDIMF